MTGADEGRHRILKGSMRSSLCVAICACAFLIANEECTYVAYSSTHKKMNHVRSIKHVLAFTLILELFHREGVRCSCINLSIHQATNVIAKVPIVALFEEVIVLCA